MKLDLGKMLEMGEIVSKDLKNSKDTTIREVAASLEMLGARATSIYTTALDNPLPDVNISVAVQIADTILAFGKERGTWETAELAKSLFKICTIIARALHFRIYKLLERTAMSYGAPNKLVYSWDRTDLEKIKKMDPTLQSISNKYNTAINQQLYKTAKTDYENYAKALYAVFGGLESRAKLALDHLPRAA